MKSNDTANENATLSIGVYDSAGSTTELLKERLSSQEALSLAALDVSLDEPSMQAQVEKLDLVIIDLDSNEEAGFGLASQIRSKRMSTPEIIFTSSNPKISIADCHKAGAVGLIEKPLDMSALKTMTNQLVERRTKIRFDLDSYPGVIKTSDTKLESTVTNIGRGGFFFEFAVEAETPKVGEVINFSIKIESFPDFILTGTGILRWIKGGPQPGAGVEFIEIPDKEHQIINAFVELFKIKAFVPSPDDEIN